MEKVIWTYWHQGWDKAPEIPAKCLSSWRSKNAGWDIRALCEKTLPEYLQLGSEVADLAAKEMDYAARSDLIRILLLRKYGGIWVDSTVLCATPLDHWIDSCLEEEFFAFDSPGEDRMISSWFLAASSSSYIVRSWCQKAVEYWRGRNCCDEYFWFHFLFNELYESDTEFKRIWDGAPKRPAELPHFFAPYEKMYFEKNTKLVMESMRKTESPVFKLTHKYDYAREKSDTVLDCILSEF